MCGSMVDIQSPAAEIRRGKKKKIEEDRRKKLQGKNIMAPLLHRAAIISRRTRATRCNTLRVLYTKVDALCDKLATVVGRTKLTTFATVDVTWRNLCK